MPTSFVDTLEIKNISNQMITINIKSSTSGAIFDKNGGNITLGINISVEAEENRLDLQQISALRKLNLIQSTPFQRSTTITGSTGTE